MAHKLSKWHLVRFHNRGIFVCFRCSKKLKLGDLIEVRGHEIDYYSLKFKKIKSATKRVYHKKCWDSLYFDDAPKINSKKKERVVKIKK